MVMRMTLNAISSFISVFLERIIILTLILGLHIHYSLPLVMKYLLTSVQLYNGETQQLVVRLENIGWSHWRNWK